MVLTLERIKPVLEYDIGNYKEIQSQQGDIPVAQGSSRSYSNSKYVRETTLSVKKSLINDVVGRRFHVLTDKPLETFSNDFINAYEVEVQNILDDNHYALVFNNRFPPRAKLIHDIRDSVIPNFITPIEIEITHLSVIGESRIVAIMPKPKGSTLKKVIKYRGLYNENFINNHLVPTVMKVLKLLGDIDAFHGSINPDNLFIDEHNAVIVGECISTPPGYYQQSIYEPLERALINPIAKGEGHVSADYYALGVLSLYILGSNLGTNKDDNAIKRSRFREGSLKALVGDMILPPGITNLVNGLLSDNKNDRWGERNLSEWSKGRKITNLAPVEKTMTSRVIEFGNSSHYTINSLSYELFTQWESGKKFIGDTRFTKWIERGLEDITMSTHLDRILHMQGRSRDGYVMTEDDQMTIALSLLDPKGPIRLRYFVAHVRGLGFALSWGYYRHDRSVIQNVIRIIDKKLVSMINEVAPNHLKYDVFTVQFAEQLRSYMFKDKYCFGVERCLYELNPSLPCQSDLLITDCVLTLGDLLISLNNRAKEDKINLMDRHIAAFIGSKMGINSEIKVRSLVNFPVFAEHPVNEMIAILAIAQLDTKIDGLTHLAEGCVTQYEEVMKLLYSSSVKQELTDMLRTQSKEGNLANIYRIVGDPSFIVRDRSGFITNMEYSRLLREQIEYADNEKLLYDIGYTKGLRVTAVLGYAFLLIEILMLVKFYNV